MSLVQDLLNPSTKGLTGISGPYPTKVFNGTVKSRGRGARSLWK